MYLYHAFAFKSGLYPFTQTLTVHPPTIEYLLAGLFNIFGASYRTAEILTGIIILFSAVLLFDISRHIFNKYIAVTITALYSFSSLFFRYHIFEREIFTLLLAILVFWLIVCKSANQYHGLLIGIFVGLGFGVKLTGLFLLPPVIIYFLFKKEFKKMFFVLSGFFAIVFVIYGYLFLYYRDSAFNQIFRFHFFKGQNIPINVRFTDPFLIHLNYLWVLGGSGIILSIFHNRLLIFPLMLFVEYAFFFLFISPTCWPHNMIDLLFPMTIGNGVALHFLTKDLNTPKKIIIPGMFIIIWATVFVSWGSLNPAYFQGLGYIPRKEVVRVAEIIRSNTPVYLPVHIPNYLAVESQRLKIIDYEECIGPYRLMLMHLKNKNRTGLNNLRFRSWQDLIESTLHLWRDEVERAIVNKKISCVVWDKVFPEWSLMYKLDKSLEEGFGILSGAGYRVIYNSPYYTVWLLQK